MAAFFRGLLLFLFGAIAGAAGILFLTPSFQVDIRRGDTAIKPLDLGTRVAQPTPAPVVPAPVPPKATAPAPAVAVNPAAPAAPAAPSVPTTPATAEPALDFAAISRHLILWPTAVTVKTPTTVVVNVEGQKPQDLALEAGAVLQLTRVLPTGRLEVRAKGTKFEIKSTSTDFAAELGKRVSELVAKGTKFDSPYPAASAVAAAPEASAPSATTVASATPVVAAPKRPLTLAERIDVLYGRKAPEPVVPTPVSTAPAAPAAPVVAAPATPVVAPAPTPATPEAAKVEEKGKDLDRKMNQLFK
jgi:2-oxoglutarate dehydrogenase E2 component (dihydrolipoamide succinyltransferase)